MDEVPINNNNNNVPHVKSKIILNYPANAENAISIFSNDYTDLAPFTFLNDAIIDFYLRYLMNEKLPKETADTIHIFTSLFYKRLTTANESEYKESDFEKKWSKEEIADYKAFHLYDRVRDWDIDVKLFEKDFIFVPVNIKEHWLLVVICFPGLLGKKALHVEDGKEVDLKFDKLSPVKQSCILIFDSTGQKRPSVIHNLRIFLKYRYQFEYGGNLEFDAKEIHGSYVDCPKQQNDFDCGVFLLQYFETFFSNPIKSYRTPIKGLHKWFQQDEIGFKRLHIKELIDMMVVTNAPENLPLPEINFDINLIQDDDQDNNNQPVVVDISDNNDDDVLIIDLVDEKPVDYDELIQATEICVINQEDVKIENNGLEMDLN